MQGTAVGIVMLIMTVMSVIRSYYRYYREGLPPNYKYGTCSSDQPAHMPLLALQGARPGRYSPAKLRVEEYLFPRFQNSLGSAIKMAFNFF